MTTRRYFRTWLETRVTPLFGERDREPVINWLVTHRGRPKVVIIGSGFSRNAELAPGEVGEKERRIPLWSDITRRLRHELSYFEENVGPQDPLLVAEQYQEALGMEKLAETLLEALRDNEIVPGRPHNALHRSNVEAIVTTNQLDTLLDRMHGDWFRVVTNTDLPVARARAEGSPTGAARQVIYLHGHRNDPTSWVFSRSEYEAIERTRPAVYRRVQQLLSEYPLLVLGYSLSDPDFHALFGRVYEEQAGYMPRALCVTVGARPMEAERAHWRRLGMHLAHLSGETAAAPSSSVPSAEAPSIGSSLEVLLTLDDGKPEPKYVLDSILGIKGATRNEAIRLRLEEYREIFNELEELVVVPSELTRLRFDAWVNCLPTYAQFQSQTDLDIRLPTPPGSLQDVEPLAWDIERNSLKTLPQTFQRFMSGQARPLLLGIDLFRYEGGDDAATREWLNEAKYRRLRAADRESLGEPISAALDELYRYFLPGRSSPEVYPTAEGAMKAASSAALSGKPEQAAEDYDRAAIEFAGRGDACGEWYARVSRRAVLQLAAQLPHRATQNVGTALEQEQASVHRLERARAVINERERRSGVLSRGYEHLSTKTAKAPSPLVFSYGLSVVSSEVYQLLQEDQALGIAPGISRELASLWVQLEADESQETLETGIRYFSPELPEILETEKRGNIDQQREHDEQLWQRLQRFLDPLHPLASAAHLCPAIAAVLGHIAPRLSPQAIGTSLHWLDERRRASKGAFVYAFGVTSRSNVDRIVVSLALNLRSDTEDAWSFIKRYTNSVGAFDGPTIWQSAAGAGWSVLLAWRSKSYGEIAEWHLTKRPLDARSESFWLQSMGNLLRTGKDLNLSLSEPTRSSILQLAHAESQRERSFLGLVEAIENTEAVLSALRNPPPTWSDDDRRQAAINLVEAGENSPSGIDGQFHEKLATQVAKAVADTPNDDKFALDVPFALVSTCLALQIGERERQIEWLHKTLTLFERAPLVMLAHAIRLERWRTAPEKDQLKRSLLEVPSSIREYHVLRLGHFLCNPLTESTLNVLGADFLAEIASTASRAIHAPNRTHATMATNCLISVLNQGSILGISPGRWDYLVGALRRCAAHPRSAVRATAALRLGELSLTGLDEEFRKVGTSLLEGDSELKGLTNDHSAYVVNFANYGVQKGEAAQRARGI